MGTLLVLGGLDAVSEQPIVSDGQPSIFGDDPDRQLTELESILTGHLFRAVDEKIKLEEAVERLRRARSEGGKNASEKKRSSPENQLARRYLGDAHKENSHFGWSKLRDAARKLAAKEPEMLTPKARREIISDSRARAFRKQTPRVLKPR